MLTVNAIRTRSTLKKHLITLFVFGFLCPVTLILYTACVEAKVIKYAKEKVGNNGNNRLNGSNDTIVYGLKGNDKLYSCRNCEDTGLMGGEGNDYYRTYSRNSFSEIMDNGGGNDRIASSLTFYRKSHRAQFATIDNRHLVAFNQYGTGFVVIDWKRSRNRIETFDFNDGEKSYSELKRDLKTLDWLGNISFSRLEREGFEYTKRDIRQTINYYSRREKSLSRKRFALSDNLSMSYSENLSDADYSSPSLRYSYDGDNYVEFGSTYDVIDYFSSSHLLGIDNQFSYIDESMRYAEVDGFMIGMTYALSPHLTINTVSFFQPENNIDGVNSRNSLTSGESISIKYENEDYGFAALAAHEIEKGTLFANNINTKWFSIDSTSSLKLGLSAAYHFDDVTTFSGWVQYGIADSDLAFSPFLEEPTGLSAFGWGMQLSRKNIFADNDRLNFKVSEPYNIKRGTVLFTAPRMLGAEPYLIPLASPAKEIEYGINYSRQHEKYNFGAAINYIQNQNGVSGVNDTELFITMEIPYSF
ncbi:MAG: hypothetical protein H6964_10500 [Chromatiaceae bacterium]|nr:hypothetical protein [Chromatiaceae bacterium]MCP5447409.1 hypothetical protein [Chromatiaceae bacterium]